MMFKKIARFGLDDVEEFEELMKGCKNEKLRQILGRDLNIIRSKLVTKVINSSTDKDRMNDEPPEPPEKVEFDENKYFCSKIRGCKRKVRALKEIHSGLSTSKIIDALIRYKGREDETMVGLFGEGKIPPRPTVPQNVLDEHERKFQESVANYERLKKNYEEKKKDSIVNDISANPNSEEILQRTNFIKKEVKNVEETCQMYGHMNVVAPRKKKFRRRRRLGSEEDDQIMEERGKLFYPGEKEAIERDEPRVFKFHPERTFSNEVNHVHFRVAESQFYRMCQAPSMRVKEVKYIVSPHLIRKFEICKRSFSNQTKQYLLFSPHVETEKEIEWIRLNNYRPKAFDRGRFFSTRREYCNRFVNQDSSSSSSGFHSLLLCLVLTGREKVQSVSTPSGKKGCNICTKPSGYDSIVDTKRDSVVVFNQDQVLPYYIITYEKFIAQGYQNNPGGGGGGGGYGGGMPGSMPAGGAGGNQQSQTGRTKHLAEEWDEMKKEANADLEQNNIKRAYLEELERKEKEKKFGKMDPTKENLWFNSYYQKQAKRENAKMGKTGEVSPTLGDDEELEIVFESPGTPGDGLSDGMFESETPIETPVDDDDDRSPAFDDDDDVDDDDDDVEEEEEEGEIVIEFMEDEK